MLSLPADFSKYNFLLIQYVNAEAEDGCYIYIYIYIYIYTARREVFNPYRL